MLDVWLSGFLGLMHLKPLLFLALGMAFGLFFGVVPGIGGTTALALLMPLTFGLDPFTALALSGGIMGAVPMGASITSILLNTPGAAPSAATCLDGYPLARQGKAGLAIGAAASSNSIGGLIGTFSVLVVLPIASQLVLLFGPPEFFLLGLFGLVTVALSSRGKMLRGLIAGGVGLLISFVGTHIVTGDHRFTFGIEYLWDGIDIVPALIGLFAVAEMINLWVKGGSVSTAGDGVKVTRMWAGVFETFKHWRTVIRGSLIGTFIGAIPGVGGTVAAFLSYSVTVQASKDPESFGKGNIQGVIAPEAAINASDGSHLIPTLALGIPAGSEMGVFLGILMLHGMQPGPMMLINHQPEIYGIVWALTASCILASFIGLIFVKPLALITKLPNSILVPVVLTVAFVGSYAVDRNPGHLILTAVFGLLGYAMIRLDYPRLAIVIALVLGAIVEKSLHQSIRMADGSWSIFVTRPICVVLIIGIVGVLALTPIQSLLAKLSSPALPQRH